MNSPSPLPETIAEIGNNPYITVTTIAILSFFVISIPWFFFRDSTWSLLKRDLGGQT